jgi:hypothetical protein
MLTIGTSTMPKAKRNPRTGLKRRQPPRYTTRDRRDGALYIKDRNQSEKIQRAIADEDEWIDLATVLFIVVGTDRIALEAAGEDTEEKDNILRFLALLIVQSQLAMEELEDLDSYIMDIPVDEEMEPVSRIEKRFSRIDFFLTEGQAKNCTNFTKTELNFFNERFGLPVGLGRGPN